jgi:hypothetical protein
LLRLPHADRGHRPSYRKLYFVMRRLSLIFLPFLAAFAMIFGLYYLYAAFKLVQLGRTVSAGLVFIFGLMGVGLSAGIWIARKRVTGRGDGPPHASSGPRRESSDARGT